jgi:hypothetical protein
LTPETILQNSFAVRVSSLIELNKNCQVSLLELPCIVIIDDRVLGCDVWTCRQVLKFRRNNFPHLQD